MNKRNIRKNEVISLAIMVAAIIAANLLGSVLYMRIDLTTEKRYTLSDTSKEILKNIDDYVFFRVYLEGDFPADFKKLRKETKEMLDEFRAYSRFIDYEFINPSESNNPNERTDTYKLLYQSGLNPTTLSDATRDGGSQQTIIWPCALISYREKEMPIDLLEGQNGNSREQVIEASTRSLEFKLIDAVKTMVSRKKASVAFIEGHGELNKDEVMDITRSLSKRYNVKRISIDEKITSLNRRSYESDSSVLIVPNYDAIIIAKPTTSFSEKDKFIIDQYIMYGGKVLWLVDPVFATMDSLRNQSSTMGIALDVNIEDQLFKYGVRINNNLVLDYNCASIAIVTGQVGGQPQMEYYRWYYFPLLNAASENNIVSNINPVKADFASSIDATTSDIGIRKTPLLKTSDYSKTSGAPVLISLEMLKQRPSQKMFSQKGKNIAYLLEGCFESLYANRMTQQLLDSEEIGFKDSSIPTSMIVVADGDIIRNQFDIRRGTPLPLGFDQYTNVTYGNKDFISNAVSYLVDGEGLLSVKSREVKIRLLDARKIQSQSTVWQVINVVGPSVVIMILGAALALTRKKKYTK
ncbi:MAG: gliding motility-associated ABC transporter substrate-binding protein GldG [Bacteroidales bacterium]|nr:gliding motility-associated ABC transporter substrate-binding protein GldG [Bacteroidales bacterium]